MKMKTPNVHLDLKVASEVVLCRNESTALDHPWRVQNGPSGYNQERGTVVSEAVLTTKPKRHPELPIQ